MLNTPPDSSPERKRHGMDGNSAWLGGGGWWGQSGGLYPRIVILAFRAQKRDKK
jgi:hypothetical protein